VNFPRIARQQVTKLGIVLLICVSLPAAVPARENGHPVTVAVFGLFRPERVDITTPQNALVSIQSGSVEVRRVLAGGQRLQVENRGERLRINLFEHDGRLLLAQSGDAVRTEETVCNLSVPGRIQRHFSGRLEVVVRRSRLLPRVTVQEEAAVQQILRSEMAGGQQPEALKAQAILVRTYLRTSTGRHQKDGYDFCDTTHCQFFTDFMAVDDRFRQAAMATRGLVLTFLGKPFQPLYTAGCGGRTLAGFADSTRTKQGSSYPYRSVSCSFCAGHPLFEWETTVETQALLRALKRESHENPSETLARLTEPGEADELGALKQATRMSVGHVLGWNIIRSNRYSVDVRSNSVKIKGHGSGHNFGLCQAGAIEMSRQGKSMSEILSFYFPGCRIE
jgi:stage II sporulation protein D